MEDPGPINPIGRVFSPTTFKSRIMELCIVSNYWFIGISKIHRGDKLYIYIFIYIYDSCVQEKKNCIKLHKYNTIKLRYYIEWVLSIIIDIWVVIHKSIIPQFEKASSFSCSTKGIPNCEQNSMIESNFDPHYSISGSRRSRFTVQLSNFHRI